MNTANIKLILLLVLCANQLGFCQPNLTDSVYMNMKKCDIPAAFLTMFSTKNSAIFAIRGAAGVVGTNGPNTDIKLFRLSPTFDTLWSKQFGGSKNDFLTAINELPNGHLLLSGTTESSDGDIWYGNGNYSSAIWLIEVDTSGNFIRGKVLGSSVGSWGTKVHVTPWGDLFVTGLTNGGDFDMAHPINSFETHGFIFKLDSLLTIRWRRFEAGDPGTTQGVLHLTSLNNVDFYYASYTNDSSVINIGQNAKGNGDVLITKMDSSGLTHWRKRFGGSLEDSPTKLVIDGASGMIYLLGSTQSEDKDIIYRTGQNSTLTGGYWNIWVLKLDTAGNILYSKAYGGDYSIPYGANTTVKDVKFHHNHLWIISEEEGGGGDLPPNNGTKKNGWISKIDTLANLRGSYTIYGNGEDEMVNLFTKNNQLFLGGGSMTYNGIANTFSCDTATVFGFYLNISDAPLSISTAHSAGHTWSLYPNPTQGIVHIELPEECEEEHTAILELYNAEGKRISSHQVKGKQFDLPIQGYPAGNYHVALRTDNARYSKALIIE